MKDEFIWHKNNMQRLGISRKLSVRDKSTVLNFILRSFEYLLGQEAVAILLEVTIESQWTILKSFELSRKSLPQVLNMQSPHLANAKSSMSKDSIC